MDRLIAALQARGAEPAGPHFEFHTYNPREEPQSVTTNKGLQKVTSLGLVK